MTKAFPAVADAIASEQVTYDDTEVAVTVADQAVVGERGVHFDEPLTFLASHKIDVELELSARIGFTVEKKLNEQPTRSDDAEDPGGERFDLEHAGDFNLG
jgi:hypothetical protein